MIAIAGNKTNKSNQIHNPNNMAEKPTNIMVPINQTVGMPMYVAFLPSPLKTG
jgi:hypothetical protein